MLKNLVRPEREKIVEHEIEFLYTEDDGSGFGFPCDERGNVLDAEMTKEAWENYRWCLEHPEKFAVYNEMKTRVRYYTPDAHGTCSCGEEVELHNQYMGACQCPKCGRWYNLFGQSLLPPEAWEDEEYAY